LSNPAELKKTVIVGLPNTGKSQVFYNLTGQYTLVANYPFTTVEIKKTKCRIDGETYEVIDTPGLHCLYIHSEEELIVRDMIFSEKPDVIVQCIDANLLKQSLTLTADLLELGIPMVISLNAIDETSRRGVWIDSDGLSRLLGVPVIESIAVNSLGTNQLKAAISKARIGKWPVKYGEIILNRAPVSLNILLHPNWWTVFVSCLAIQKHVPMECPYQKVNAAKNLPVPHKVLS